MALILREQLFTETDTNYTNCHEPQQACAYSCGFVKFMSLRREGNADRHVPCDLEIGRFETKLETYDNAAIFTRD
jgi:hypothetical protein